MFKAFADTIVYNSLKLSPNTHLAKSVHFFIGDVIKIYVLLITIVFVVAIIRSFFPPSRIKRFLSHKRAIFGNISAAFLGILTPFCTCSAIPLFIGFLESGVPLGVTMSFLVSSPTVNEIALILLFGLFGWRIALTYAACGLLIAIVSGYIIGKLGMEKEVEEFVYKIKVPKEGDIKESWKERIQNAAIYTKEIFQRVWFLILIGVGIGAWIHGYVPIDWVSTYAGSGNPFAVLIAVAIGVPLYSNAAGIIPVVQALMEKGMTLGTILAFMMSVTALSLPEIIILRDVLKPKLLVIFISIVAVAIVIIGYVFNFII
jgi:uncharacterized membrane protein YraQ (UPF0718 family)